MLKVKAKVQSPESRVRGQTGEEPKANIQHSTFNIQHSTFNIQHSTFNIQHSTFNIQHSTFNIQHSTFNIHPAGGGAASPFVPIGYGAGRLGCANGTVATGAL